MYKPLRFILCAASFFTLTTLHAATINWGAQLSNGIGTATGVPLANGSGALLRVGWFNFNTDVTLNNTAILANASDRVTLNQHFIEFGNSFIGSGNPNGSGASSDGYWTGISSNPGGQTPDSLGIANQQVYYWLFNNPSLSNATQYGVYTAPGNSNWVFPPQAAVPNTNTNDLSQVPHNATGIVIGSYGTGTSKDTVSPLFNLAVVPEPSSIALLGLGVMALFGWRKSRS